MTGNIDLYLASVVVAGTALGVLGDTLERLLQRRWWSAALYAAGFVGLVSLSINVWKLA